MAVPEQTPFIEYTANGTTTNFALTFDCDNSDYLIVTLNGVDASVGSWSLVGTSIVFTTAPLNGVVVAIKRDTPLERTTDYQLYDNSFLPTAVNKDFDRIWRKLQELGYADWLLNNKIDQEILDRIASDEEILDYILNQDNTLKADYIARDAALKDYIDQMIALVTGDPSFTGITANFVIDDSGKTQQEINDFIKAKNLISITDYGAIGDGVTDDSNAIQAALDTGLSVFIPETDDFWKVTRRMELRAVGQKVYGLGSKSFVKMVNALVCESVFRAADLGKNRFENVHAIPSVDGTLNWGGGVGFMVQRSPSSSVVNCEVSGHRGGGISLLGSSYCYIAANNIHDSVVVPDEAIGRWGNDILVNNGSFNIITNNRCVNGSGIGIAIQNLFETDISNSNKITGNIIKEQDVYGIMLYKKFPADQILRNEIINNTIDGVSGSIREPLGYAYGCGIYVQTADQTIVQGNVIIDAMGRSKDGTAPYEIHTPAAIGVASVANCSITGNKVIGSGWYGIQVISSTALTARGSGIKIANNDVQTSNRIGIYVQDIPKVAILNNTVNQLAGSQAILVRQNVLDQSVLALVSHNEMQSDNTCFEASGNIAYLKFNDNTAEGTTAGYCVQLGGLRVDALSNYINPANTSASGIRIGANITNGFLDDNDIVKGNIGIGYANASTGNMFIGDKNRNSASIPFNNGSANTMWRVLSNSGTPSVQGINLAIRNDVVNITGLTGAVRGQRVILKAGASFSLINSASMQLSGGVNFAMVSGNLITLFNDDGIWREESRSLTT